MTLYITKCKTPVLSGTVIAPEHLNKNFAHAVIASQQWDTLYIDIDECIQENRLRFIPSHCSRIVVGCTEPLSRHQMVLITELYPALGGKIRKEFLRGGNVKDVLPEVWEHGEDA